MKVAGGPKDYLGGEIQRTLWRVPCEEWETGTLGSTPGCLTQLPLRDENWARASVTGGDGVGQGGEGALGFQICTC